MSPRRFMSRSTNSQSSAQRTGDRVSRKSIDPALSLALCPSFMPSPQPSPQIASGIHLARNFWPQARPDIEFPVLNAHRAPLLPEDILHAGDDCVPVEVWSFFPETGRPRTNWRTSSSTLCAERFPSMRALNRGDGDPTIPYFMGFRTAGCPAHGARKAQGLVKWGRSGRYGPRAGGRVDSSAPRRCKP
jgi:hypothetical protein